MLRTLIFGATLIIGAGLASLAAAPARADQAPAAAACPEKLVGQDSLICACSAEATASGSVWGSDLYTDDSNICRAARHAGLIGADGGTIWVFERPGLDSYQAAERNGISSSRWATWRRSIAFRPASEAPADSAPRAAACPSNATTLEIGTALSCSCTIEAIAWGSVWGGGPYTADSGICRAARHNGGITAYGGNVRVRVTPGEASYPASERNGISAGAWPAYDKSFIIER